MCSIPILHLPDMTASVYANPKLICAARTLSQVQLNTLLKYPRNYATRMREDKK